MPNPVATSVHLVLGPLGRVFFFFFFNSSLILLENPHGKAVECRSDWCYTAAAAEELRDEEEVY